MDFSKIITDSLAAVHEEFGDNIRFQYKVEQTQEDKSCVVPHKMLMAYSEALLENYHSELQKKLKASGIDI